MVKKSAFETFHSNDTAFTKVSSISHHSGEDDCMSEKLCEPFNTAKNTSCHIFDSFTTDADFPAVRAQISNNDYKDSLVDQISFADESFQVNLIRVEDENENEDDLFAEVTVLEIDSEE